MKQIISTQWTFVIKFIPPLIITALSCYEAFTEIINPALSSSLAEVITVTNIVRAIIYGVLLAEVFCISSKIKRIAIDDSYLYISNYICGIKVPLSSVEQLYRFSGIMPDTLSILFNEKTEFGKRLIFVPRNGKDTIKQLQSLLDEQHRLDRLSSGE